ncbi:hypothetical protein SALBM135S_00978 [Streptomyces alboniger]
MCAVCPDGGGPWRVTGDAQGPGDEFGRLGGALAQSLRTRRSWDRAQPVAEPLRLHAACLFRHSTAVATACLFPWRSSI